MYSILLFVCLFVFTTVNTQYSSKCNFPILRNFEEKFIDFRFPQEWTTIKPETGTSNIKVPFWKNFGANWTLTNQKNSIKIKFSNPVLITSFAINSCDLIDEKCSNSDANPVFKFDYKSPDSVSYIRVKPVHYPDGRIELSNNLEGLPTEIGFEQILAEHIRVTKVYPLSLQAQNDNLIQLELFGCTALPENTISLNPNILHYDVTPSYTLSNANTLNHGWCNEMACRGLTSTLFDGIIVYDTTYLQNRDLLSWNKDTASISLKIFFKETYIFTDIVIHCIINGKLGHCIPEVQINGVIVKSRGTAHGRFEFSLEDNLLEIVLVLRENVEFVLSEIEVFGQENADFGGDDDSFISDDRFSIFVSAVFFIITLSLIIILLIAVVVICIKIKKRTYYIPIHQKNQKPQEYTAKPPEPREEPVSNDPSKLYSQITSIDPNIDPPYDSVKRVDTITLNNMYERIPTIPTIQGIAIRESIKRTIRPNGPEYLSTSPRPKLPEIPIYSKPIKNKVTVNRPSSHEGYLELRNVSVNDSNQDFTPFDDDNNPLYDYIRPRSAMLPVSDSNVSIGTPIPEYINTKQQQQQDYFNTHNNTTSL